MKNLKYNKRSDSLLKQRGAALIVVLSFMVLLSLIISTIVVLSKTSARKVKIEGDRVTAGYLAEGAAARLQWLLMDDIKKHPDSNALKRFDSIMNQSSATRRFMANGALNSILYYDAKITARIFDMSSGFTISGGQGASSMKTLSNIYRNNPDLYNVFKTLIDTFSDYVGAGMGQSVRGATKSDYNSLGLYPLPRNNPMQYRDEMLWLPGSSEFFQPDSFGQLSLFNVISNDFFASQVNFFSAGKTVIMALCNYSEQDAQYIIEGRERWFKTPSLSLYNFIDQKYLTRLKEKFSFQDSGYYTFIINASANQDGSYSREMVISLKIGASMSGSSNQYYQYIIY